LLKVFKFDTKKGHIALLSLIGGLRDKVRWLIDKLLVDFLFVLMLIELFRYVLRLRRYKRISVGIGVFEEGWSVSVKFSRRRGFPPLTIFVQTGRLMNTGTMVLFGFP